METSPKGFVNTPEQSIKPRKKKMAKRTVIRPLGGVYKAQEEADRGQFNWADETTWHGVKDCYHSANHCARMFWLLVVFGCLAMAIFQILGLVNAFLTAPHYVTNVYVQDSDSNEFPNITICNLNRINRTLARQLNFSANAISYFFLALPVSSDIRSVDFVPDKIGEHRDEWLYFVEHSGLPSYDVKYLLRLFGHQCAATMLGCAINGNFDCCNNSIPIINSEYGLCWSVTPPITPPAKHAVQSMADSGRRGGIKMFINVAKSDYASDVMFNNHLEEGIVLLLDHNPYQLIHRNPVQITPGSRASVSMQNTMRITKKPDYEVFTPLCLENGTLKYMKGAYTQRSCMEECYLDVIYEACGCLMVTESVLDVATCSADQMMSCGWPAAENAFIRTDENGAIIKNDCMSGCRDPCEWGKDVDITLSTSAYPSKTFIKPITELLAANGSGRMNEEVIKNIIMLNLFFPSRGFTIVEKTEKTPLFELVANIGGQMGLWMGASIVTVIQAVYHFTGRLASNRSKYRFCRHDPQTGSLRE